jgi:hypothetical protein
MVAYASSQAADAVSRGFGSFLDERPKDAGFPSKIAPNLKLGGAGIEPAPFKYGT